MLGDNAFDLKISGVFYFSPSDLHNEGLAGRVHIIFVLVNGGILCGLEDIRVQQLYCALLCIHSI